MEGVVAEGIAAAPAESAGDLADRPYDLLARILHWLMAVLIVTMLFLGAALVGTIGDYARLLNLHRTVGLAILALAVVRIVNRLWRRAPAPGAGLPPAERAVAVGTEFALYALFVAQPVVGWALVSASGIPVRVAGGIVLPAIAPENAALYAQLRTLHAWLAYLLLALFTAHMCGVLWHVAARQDGLVRRMLWARRG
ncbi:cytochrome b [Nocardia sp. NPDC020380]|uniref:cytochrome b n=1 Tax=Nocardia sp. NPDC020380 TaxID=3364309 RepID=UPI00378E3775